MTSFSKGFISLFFLSGYIYLKYHTPSYLKMHKLTKFDIGSIVSGISLINWAMTHNNIHPITDQLYKAMVKTILSFGVPNTNQLLQPCPDDCKCLRDRLIFTNEPQLQTIIAQLPNKAVFDKVAVQVYGLLPILPIYFRDWDSEKKVV